MSESPETMKPILVNGEAVSDALIEQELQMLQERYAREMSGEEMERRREKIESDARENAVERILLMQKARDVVESVRPEEVEARFFALQQQHGGEEEFGKRFDLSEEDLRQVKCDIEDGVKLETYFDEICKDVPRPVEADSRAYYDEHAEQFLDPEMVHAGHILQAPRPGRTLERVNVDLLNARERILAGEDFIAVAEEMTDCSDGSHDLGFFARGQMVPSFEKVAFATPEGEVSDLFQTEFGYHILKVFEKSPETLRTFDEVRYDIESMLYENRKNDAIGVVADELRSAADIQNLVVVK